MKFIAVKSAVQNTGLGMVHINKMINKMIYTMEKWFWMMEYCKDNSIPPAQKWAWSEAEKEYELHQLNK